MSPVLNSGFLGLLLLVLPVGAQEETKYFEIDGTLVLEPKVSAPITSITWKHKGNIVAEWIKDVIAEDYLGDFKGRSHVDVSTGILTIRGIKKEEEGIFTVEINSQELPVKYKAVGLRSVAGVRVDVVVIPLTCSDAMESCSLECRGDFTNADPVQFFWREGSSAPWVEKTKTIPIIKDEKTKKIDSFSCKAKNFFGETESKAEPNPLNQQASATGSGVGAIVGVIVGLLAVAAVGGAGVFYYKRKQKQRDNAKENPELSPMNGGNNSPSTPMLVKEDKAQAEPPSTDSHSVDVQNPGEADPEIGAVTTVYSAVRSSNPGEEGQPEVPNATEKSEKELDSSTPNDGL